MGAEGGKIEISFMSAEALELLSATPSKRYRLA